MWMFGSKRCNCNQLPQIFKVEDQGRFVRKFVEVGRRAGNWLQLFRCRACGQHWQLDLPDKYQVNCAIKIDDPDDWQSFDDQPVRLQFLIESYGGLSEEECVMARCANKALKSLAYCPAHAYEIGLRD